MEYYSVIQSDEVILDDLKWDKPKRMIYTELFLF